MRHILSAVTLLTMGALVTSSPAQQRSTVKVAVVPSIPSASTYLALDKGYFRDAGLDVTIERIDSLSRAVAFLATNQMQVGQGGISAGFFNAVADGLRLPLEFNTVTKIADALQLQPDFDPRSARSGPE